jgi:ankyrin repeat protein
MKAASKASSAKRMLPIIQMLLDAGADVQVRDTYGQTALDKARFATGHKTSSNPIVELLQKRLDQQKKGM